MIISVQKVLGSLAIAGFLLLFPTFIFYHYIVATSFIPPVAGGLFGPAALMMALAYLLLLPWVYAKLVASDPIFLFGVIAFFYYVMGWTLAYYVLGEAGYTRAASQQSLETLIFWISLFFIGCFLPVESISLRNLTLACSAIISLYILYYVASTGSTFFYVRELYHADSRVATYQGFARSALVIWILMLSLSKTDLGRSCIVVSGIFVMFVLGARSELYAYLLVSFAIFAIPSIGSAKGILMVLVVFAALAYAVAQFSEAISSSRQLQILDLSASDSWSARQNLQSVAWGQIKQNPFWGDFGAHVARGGAGSYAHNLLSAWVNYGVIGFFMYVLLTVTAFAHSSYRCVVRGFLKYDIWVLSFSTNMVCLLLILTSKSVFWPLVALGWGIHMNAMRRAKRPKKAELRLPAEPSAATGRYSE